MTECVKVERMRERWLCPEPVGDGCTCGACGKSLVLEAFFSLSGGETCEECVLDSRYDLHDDPELSEKGYRCAVCGCVCDEAATLLCGDVYCDECLADLRIDWWG